MQFSFKKIMRDSFFLFVLFVIPNLAHSATLFSSPGEIQTKAGDTFVVSINTNSEGVAINAASLDVKYDTSFLSVQGISRSNSIFNLWTVEPTHLATAGIIRFSGGLSSPGYTGANGNIIKVTFVAKKEGQTQVQLSNGLTLANDGLGTNVFKGAYGSNISISKATVIPPKPKEKVEEKKKEEVEDEEEGDSSEEPLTFDVPIIENITDTLYEGDTLILSGKTIPNEEMQLYIQKGKGDIEIMLIRANDMGEFNFTYKYPVLSGYYKVWIKNVSSLGVLGQSSEIEYVEVLSKSSLTLFNTQISYKDIALYGSLVFLVLACLFIFFFTPCIKNLKKKYLK